MARPRNTSTAKSSTTSSEPDFPCITCGHEVTDKSIQCDGCDRWTHSKQGCSGLPNKLASEIMKSKVDSVQYICNPCRSKPGTGSSTGAVLKSLNQINITLQGIATGLNDLQAWKGDMLDWRKRVDDALDHQSTGRAPTLDRDEMRSIIREEQIELRERDKRKTSIVIKGLNFSTADSFKVAFDDVTDSLIGLKIDATDIAPITPRLVRLNVANKDHRMRLLTSASKLKNHETYGHIFISKDLTYRQRTELKTRRQNSRLPASRPVSGANAVALAPSTRPPPRVQSMPSRGSLESTARNITTGSRGLVSASQPAPAPILDPFSPSLLGGATESGGPGLVSASQPAPAPNSYSLSPSLSSGATASSPPPYFCSTSAVQIRFASPKRQYCSLQHIPKFHSLPTCKIA